MDENNNEYNNEDEIDQIERKMKNMGKDAGRKVGDLAKKLLKEAVKALIRAIGIKLIIISIVVVLVIIVVAGAWYIIKEGVFEEVAQAVSGSTEDGSGDVKKITKINNREYNIDTEELNKRLNDAFDKSKVDPEIIGLSKDYSLLKKFLEAELVTSFPDLRERNYIGTPTREGEIQGCIQFHRKKADNTTVVLEYMPYSTYTYWLATVGTYIDENQTQKQIYFEKADIEKVYNDLESKFTLDEEQNLIIVNMSSTQKQVVYSDHAKKEGKVDESQFTYTIVAQKIYYQSIVQKYTMPFDFLVAILMTSQNAGFCESIVGLVKDSKIVIDVQENKVNKVTTDVYSYIADFKLEKNLEYYYYRNVETDSIITDLFGIPTYKLKRVDDSKKVTGTKQITVNPYSTTTTTINDSQLQLGITEAKNWIVEYYNTYTNTSQSQTVESSTWSEQDDSSYAVVEDYYNLLNEVKFNDLPFLYFTKDGCYEKIEQKRINKNYTTNTVETVNTYVKNTPIITETPEKFLSLLKIDPNTGKYDIENERNNAKVLTYVCDSIGSKKSPIGDLMSSKEILYEMLESNSKTVQLKDVMEYLFDIYEGKKRKSASTDIFEIYKTDDFINVTAPGGNQDHSAIQDIEEYNLNVFNGYIEYKQTDYKVVPPSYKATTEPAGTIKDKGCMPTSISIILSGLGVKDSYGNAYTPESLISTGTIASNIPGGSSSLDNAAKTFNKCGIQISGYRSTKSASAKNDIKNSLNQGKPILIHAGQGFYTGTGHYMTLIGISGEQVYLSNPGSRSKNGWVSLSLLIDRNVDWYAVCNI